jgi:hypothetical protein
MRAIVVVRGPQITEISPSIRPTCSMRILATCFPAQSSSGPAFQALGPRI